MPCYPFICESCGHEGDVTVPWKVYEENGGVFSCPNCDGKFTRLWFGKGNAPRIKTITRLEDIWRKNGVIDPEDPAYAKLNRERVKEMREKTRKKKERLLDQGKAKLRRVNIESDDEPFTKEVFDKMPSSSKSSYHITKDGNIVED